MYLEDADVAADEGMLFVFPSAETRAFWMRKTYVRLDLAFIDAGGSITNTASLIPLDESPVISSSPAKFALEVKQGTLNRLGITAGMSVLLPAGISAEK